jgi:hypothetical protein
MEEGAGAGADTARRARDNAWEEAGGATTPGKKPAGRRLSSAARRSSGGGAGDADKPQDKPQDKPRDKPQDKLQDKPQEQHKDKPQELHRDKPQEQHTDKSHDKPAAEHTPPPVQRSGAVARGGGGAGAGRGRGRGGSAVGGAVPSGAKLLQQQQEHHPHPYSPQYHQHHAAAETAGRGGRGGKSARGGSVAAAASGKAGLPATSSGLKGAAPPAAGGAPVRFSALGNPLTAPPAAKPQNVTPVKAPQQPPQHPPHHHQHQHQQAPSQHQQHQQQQQQQQQQHQHQQQHQQHQQQHGQGQQSRAQRKHSSSGSPGAPGAGAGVVVSAVPAAAGPGAGAGASSNPAAFMQQQQQLQHLQLLQQQAAAMLKVAEQQLPVQLRKAQQQQPVPVPQQQPVLQQQPPASQQQQQQLLLLQTTPWQQQQSQQSPPLAPPEASAPALNARTKSSGGALGDTAEVGAAARALSTLQNDVVRLQRETEELAAQNIELGALLLAEKDAFKKAQDDKRTLENVLKTLGNIRSDLEAQRDHYLSMYRKEELAKKAVLGEVADLKAALARAGQGAGGAGHARGGPAGASGDAALLARSVELEAAVHKLGQELADSQAALASAQRDASIKALDLEVKEAQEEYMKIRLDNLEAELAEKDSVANDLSGKLVQMQLAFHQQQELLAHLAQAQVDAARHQAEMVSTGTSTQRVAVCNAETQGAVCGAALLGAKPASLAEEGDLEERKTFSVEEVDDLRLDSLHVSEPSPSDEEKDPELMHSSGLVEHDGEAGDAAAEEEEGEEEQAPEQVHEHGAEEGKGQEQGDDSDEVEGSDQDDEDPAWLFSIRPTERDMLRKTLEFEPSSMHVIADARKLSQTLVKLLDRFMARDAALRRLLTEHPASSPQFWLGARELLSKVCDRRDCLFVLVCSDDDGEEQKSLQTKFVNVLADAYEGCEKPGQVVLALESDQVRLFVEGQDPTHDEGHTVVLFSQWHNDSA